LLADTPVVELDKRLDRVLDKVIGAALDAVQLSAAERAAMGLCF